MRAICPGSFDPVTYGHLDIIDRARHLFDEVVVAVGRNSSKNYLFTPDERQAMLGQACAGRAGVTVVQLDGLLVDFCREHGCEVIVKGLRFAGDFEFELQMAQMNRSLTGIDTVLLPTAARWASLSSTIIREVATLGGDVSEFVPPAVNTLISAKIARRKEEGS
jgi:pantetheine-phosphate adenylyltransferase